MKESEQCTHAIVAQVKIEHVDGKTVSFSTRSASKSGKPDDCLLKTFTCPIADVWTAPIAGAPAPVAMTPGATGNLFLSRDGWNTKSSDGYQIYGADSDLPLFKYPDGAGTPALETQLSVVPTSIVVRGTLEGGSKVFNIDLLGPDAADAQEFTWSGADCIELRLTPAGSQHLQLHDMTAKVWPTRITVSGAPAIDRSVTGAVDLLDGKLAAQRQDIKFTKHGAVVSLLLTQDGFGMFHVVPGTGSKSATSRHASHPSNQ